MTRDKKLQNKRQPYSPHPHIIVQFNVPNPLYPLKTRGIKAMTLSLKRLPILLCNLTELLAQRASSTERGGISELWETIGLCFSFYNGAEPNKET